MQVKSDIFECLLQIPSPLYQGKFVHILHSVCEEIVTEDFNRTPHIYKKMIHNEDLIIGKESKSIDKFYA